MEGNQRSKKPILIHCYTALIHVKYLHGTVSKSYYSNKGLHLGMEPLFEWYICNFGEQQITIQLSIVNIYSGCLNCDHACEYCAHVSFNFVNL